MEKKFKFEHMTVTYKGNGQYTLMADPGYQLRNRKDGNTATETATKDYTQWEPIVGTIKKTRKKKS